MLIRWFSAIDKDSYNIFKKFIEWANKNNKVPEWDTIIQTTLDKSFILDVTHKSFSTEVFKKWAFHWVSIKWNTIKVRYDWFWPNDTLKIKYNIDNGNILKWEVKWIKDKNENIDFENQSEINSSLMNDNIKNLEQIIKEKASIRKKYPYIFKVPWENIVENNKDNIKKVHDIVTPMKIDWVVIYEKNWIVHLKNKVTNNNAYFTINNTENAYILEWDIYKNIIKWAKNFKSKWDKVKKINKST
jgi:hypothetical protein